MMQGTAIRKVGTPNTMKMPQNLTRMTTISDLWFFHTDNLNKQILKGLYSPLKGNQSQQEVHELEPSKASLRNFLSFLGTRRRRYATVQRSLFVTQKKVPRSQCHHLLLSVQTWPHHKNN